MNIKINGFADKIGNKLSRILLGELSREFPEYNRQIEGLKTDNGRIVVQLDEVAHILRALSIEVYEGDHISARRYLVQQEDIKDVIVILSYVISNAICSNVNRITLDASEMCEKKFVELKRVVNKCLESRWNKKDILAEIYNLYQEYLISIEQEKELFDLVDPEENFEDVADYWFDEQRSCFPIWDFVVY